MNSSASPAASALAAAIAAVTGSASTAYTRMPARAAASASGPEAAARGRPGCARRRRQPGGPPVGDHPAGGLLQAGAGEEHPSGRRAELADRPAAQLGLGQRRRGQRRRHPGARSADAAASGSPPATSAAAERGRPLGGTQRRQLIEIHPAIVPVDPEILAGGARRAGTLLDGVLATA